MEGLKFSLNVCQVYHTSGALGHVYGNACQLEGILGTFVAKLRELFFSLIVGFIMGGSDFSSKLLLSLTSQWLCWGHV